MHSSGVRQASEEIFDDSCSAEKSPWPQSLGLDVDVCPTGQVSDPLNPASSKAQRQPVLEGDQCEGPSMIWAAGSSNPPGLAEEAGVEAGGAGLAPRSAASSKAEGAADSRTKAASHREFSVTSGNKDSSTNMSNALLMDVNNRRAQAQIPRVGEGAADSIAQFSAPEEAASTAGVEGVMLSGERKDEDVQANQTIELESRGGQTRGESKDAPLERLPRILSRPWMTRIKASDQDPDVAIFDLPPNAMDASESMPAPGLRSSQETGEVKVGARISLIKAGPPEKEMTCPEFKGGDEAPYQGVPRATSDLASVFHELQIDTSDASWSDGVTGDTSFTATGDGVESGSSLAGDGIGTAQEASSPLEEDTDSALMVSRVEEVGSADVCEAQDFGSRRRHFTEQSDLQGLGLEESGAVGANKSMSTCTVKTTEGLSLLAKGASQRIWPTETLSEQEESGGESDSPVSKAISASNCSYPNGEAVAPGRAQAVGHTRTADESMLMKEGEASGMTPLEDRSRSGQADAPCDSEMSREAVRDTTEPGKTAVPVTASRVEQVSGGDAALGTLESEPTPPDLSRVLDERTRVENDTNRSGSPCVGRTDSRLADGISASAVGTGAVVHDSSKRSRANIMDPLRYVSGAGDEKARAPSGTSAVADRGGGGDTAARAGEMRVNVFTPQGDIDTWPSPDGQVSSRITVAEAAALMGSGSGHSVASGSLWGTSASSAVFDGNRVGRSYQASCSSRSFPGGSDRGNPFADEDDSSLNDAGTEMRSASLATAMAMAAAAINAANARCAASSSFPGADAFLSPSVEIDMDTGARVVVERAKSHEIGSEQGKPNVVTGERKRNLARIPATAGPRPVEQASWGNNEILDGRDPFANRTLPREGSDGSADRRRESTPTGASESGTSALSNALFGDERVRKGAAIVASRRTDSSVGTQNRRQDELELSKTGAVVVPEASGVGAAQLGDGVGAASANSDVGRNRGTRGVGRCCVLS